MSEKIFEIQILRDLYLSLSLCIHQIEERQKKQSETETETQRNRVKEVLCMYLRLLRFTYTYICGDMEIYSCEGNGSDSETSKQLCRGIYVYIYMCTLT